MLSFRIKDSDVRGRGTEHVDRKARHAPLSQIRRRTCGGLSVQLILRAGLAAESLTDTSRFNTSDESVLRNLRCMWGPTSCPRNMRRKVRIKAKCWATLGPHHLLRILFSDSYVVVQIDPPMVCQLRTVGESTTGSYPLCGVVLARYWVANLSRIGPCVLLL